MNGKEKDDEISLYNYGFRMYDPRLGRFISVDPVARQFPFFSPYQYAGNKPIWATDLDGLETNYTNAVDPVPSEQPLYGRRDESDPHTESLQVGKQGTDWRYSTQQLFHWHDGNIKWKSLPGQQTVYFEQLTPVCKVITYKTIITEKQIVTPEQKAEYRVITKQTNIARQGTIVGANVNVTQLSNTASMLVGFRTDEAIADNGTPISINFVVQNINDPNIASIRNAIQASSGLPVNLTQDPNILSQYQYSVNYKKTIQTKAAVPGTTTTVKTEEKVPVESYAPCTPSSGSTSGTTEKPPQ